jgi:integrase
VKCDGDKKGLDVRAVEVPFPENASIEVKKRWHKIAHDAKKGLVVKVEPTAKQTVGQRLTQAAKNIAKSAGVSISAYSLRQRYSAQLKQSNSGDAIAVALGLGHQSTKTQENYARAKRGGKDVSPVEVLPIDLKVAEIRGPHSKSGPALHTREQKQISRVIGDNPIYSAPRPQLRL